MAKSKQNPIQKFFNIQEEFYQPLSFAERMESMSSGKATMLKNQSIIDRTRTVSGNPTNAEKLLLTHPVVNMVVRRMADFIVARDYNIIDGDVKEREQLQKFFKKINFPSILNSIECEGQTYGKSPVELIMSYFNVDADGIPEINELGEIIYHDFDAIEDMDLRVLSPQIIKEIYHDVGYVRYYQYIADNASLEGDKGKTPTILNRDEIAIYYVGKLAGREYGSSVLNALTYTLDSIDRCDVNMNIMTDKYSVSFYAIELDKAYLDKFSDGTQLINAINTVMNNRVAGQNPTLLPGTKIVPITFSMDGIEGILAVRNSLVDEVCMNMGFSPALLRGTNTVLTPMELSAINAELKRLEGFFNSDLIPKLLRRRGYDIPRIQFTPEVDVMVKMAKYNLMNMPWSPENRHNEVLKLGVQPDPKYDDAARVGSSQGGASNQVDSKTGKAVFDETNPRFKQSNFSGSKEPDNVKDRMIGDSK